MILDRYLQKEVETALFKGKTIIILGARQVGKTTLVKRILQESPLPKTYLNCDEPDVRSALQNRTSSELRSFIGNAKLIVIDEAQRVENIGLTLKLLHDTFDGIQVVATGSSSFELANTVNEPLTGRSKEFFMYPVSIHELSNHFTPTELDRTLAHRMIYGMYPEIIELGAQQAEKQISAIASNYLYKDILAMKDIRRPDVLEKILQALALQVGQQVSRTEIGNLVGVQKETVSSYIELLKQAYIIYELQPFSRNVRNELKKMRKIYFYDNGIRNAIIRNFNPLELRQDTGALWENFLMSERLKYHGTNQKIPHMYFWRTQAQQEIDLVEEGQGRLHAYEMKWGEKKTTVPKAFQEGYPDATYTRIDRSNYKSFIVDEGLNFIDPDQLLLE